MSGPDDSTIDVVRKATGELAGKFDYEYWREKDKFGEYPWEFVNAFAQGCASPANCKSRYQLAGKSSTT